MTTTYEFQSNFARRYYGQGRTEGLTEGRAKGEIEALLTVIETRRISLTDADRARIQGCTDIGQLDTWVQRAATATTTADIF